MIVTVYVWLQWCLLTLTVYLACSFTLCPREETITGKLSDTWRDSRHPSLARVVGRYMK